MVRLLVLVLALALASGCGDENATSTETTTTPSPVATAGRAYFLGDHTVWPVARELETPAVAASALASLYEGPSLEEQTDLDMTSAVPSGGATPRVEIENGVARVEETTRSPRALAQIVFTLTQFPTVESVEIDGKQYTRADFEEQTPSVLVESPLPFADVTSPLHVTGTANTFEATFQYELLDAEGNVVDKNFVTATSGTGTRGTFDFTTGDFDDVATLVVFENSAEDGSRVHEVEIPLNVAS